MPIEASGGLKQNIAAALLSERLHSAAHYSDWHQTEESFIEVRSRLAPFWVSIITAAHKSNETNPGSSSILVGLTGLSM
jgi:hypothetical protein